VQIRGSVDGCDRAARELQRAAAEVWRTAQALQRAEVAGWTGTSAQGWERLSSRRVAELRRLADVLAAFGRAVREHAEGIEQLHDVARRLTAQAAEAGLVLDADGWIRPVRLPEGGSAERLREALERQEARRRVLAAVAEVRDRERDLHDRLRAAATTVHDRSAAVRSSGDRLDVAWLPGWWDLPAFGVSAAQAAAERTHRLPPVLRHAGPSSGLGFGVGVAVDLQAGRDWDDALTKNVLVTGGVVVAGLAAGGSAPALVVVGAGAATGHVVGRVFDAFGHHLPWVERPRPAPVRRVAAAPRAVGPTPGPTPTPGPPPRQTRRAAPRATPGPAPRATPGRR
jgi:hypothetical protein